MYKTNKPYVIICFNAMSVYVEDFGFVFQNGNLNTPRRVQKVYVCFNSRWGNLKYAEMNVTNLVDRLVL